MSGAEKRLDRLLPALSAKERAILMLRDFKADKTQERQLIRSAPDAQALELNRLIGLMNAANGDLAHVLLVIRERARLEEVRFSWLQWARMCALEMWGVRAHFLTSGKDAITESDYREREAEARGELLSLDECATIYAEDYHIWDEADYTTDEKSGEQFPTDEAWFRVRNQKAKELHALVAAGALPGKGKGKRLKIACGAFYDWLGQPVPVAPDFGIEFDVQPDHREREVGRSHREHEFIRDILDRGAFNVELPLDMTSSLVMSRPNGRFGVELARVVAVIIRTGVQENWRQLRAIEEQIDAITEEYDGEDVLHERMRGCLEDAKATLVDVHKDLQAYTGPFDLPEPDEDLRSTIQRIVDREVQHVPTL